MVGLESLCVTAGKAGNYVGKPRSHIGLLMHRAMYAIKASKEVGQFISFRDLFVSVLKPLSQSQAHTETKESENVKEEETTEIVNDFNDTKRLANQLLSTKNPQELMREKRGRLMRQLSVYSHVEEEESDCACSEGGDRAALRSTGGLFRARLSPIRTPSSQQSTERGTNMNKGSSRTEAFSCACHMPVELAMSSRQEESVSTNCTRVHVVQTQQPPCGLGAARGDIKVLDSCCSDATELPQKSLSSYVKVVDDPLPDHSFSVERTAAPQEQVQEEEDCGTPFETARFQKQQPGVSNPSTEREFEHSLKTGQFGTQKAPSGVDWEVKYQNLRVKARKNKELLQKQNVQLGSLLARCEMQEDKIKKLHV